MSASTLITAVGVRTIDGKFGGMHVTAGSWKNNKFAPLIPTTILADVDKVTNVNVAWVRLPKAMTKVRAFEHVAKLPVFKALSEAIKSEIEKAQDNEAREIKKAQATLAAHGLSDEKSAKPAAKVA